jgi:glycosyltransferase involved in cell wall biosynthesis
MSRSHDGRTEDGTATVPVTVVVPVRNGADLAEECLASVLASRPDEVIVVDGGSTDGTLDVVRRLGLRVVQDSGRGPAAARMLGARAARNQVVVLLDIDVVLPRGELARWYDEFLAGGWDGLQADLYSESLERGYWGSSQAERQRISRARWWFALCATMIDREVLLTEGLDSSLASGEDIEFRHRLKRAGLRVSVSRDVRVRHRFRDDFADARRQWADDGAGLVLNIRKNGVRDLPLLGLPLAGFLRGVWLTVADRPKMLGYWSCYLFFTYVAMVRGIFGADPQGPVGERPATWLLGAAVLPPLAAGVVLGVDPSSGVAAAALVLLAGHVVLGLVAAARLRAEGWAVSRG